MSEGKSRMTLLSLAWPLLVESFLRLLMGNVNVFMLSKYSDEAVGAVGVANQVISMVLVMYSIVGTGTAIIISQYLGAGKKKEAGEAASVALLANLCFGAMLSVLMVVFGRSILRLMNLDDTLMAYALPYTLIIGGASFTQALMATMSAVARSYGHTNFPAYVALGMNLLNALLNYIVIFRPFNIPDFGVPGVACSVVVSQLLGLAVMSYILSKHLNIRMKLSSFRPFPKEVLSAIVRVGTPAAGEYMSYTASQVATTGIITLLGATAITTNVYAKNFTFIVWVLGQSIGQATQILIGHMVGAGKRDEAYAVCFKSLKLALCANLAMSVIFCLFRRQIFGLFTHDQSIIELGSAILLLDIAVEGGRVFNLVVMNSLRGSGDVRYPVIMGIFSMWGISVTLCYILGLRSGFGLAGIWIAYAADEWFRGLVMLRRWYSKKWQSMSLISGKKLAS